jgi:hypothetical protein
VSDASEEWITWRMGYSQMLGNHQKKSIVFQHHGTGYRE